MSKPDNIIYGTEDRLPVPILLALALQHVTILSIYLVSPVVIASAAGFPIGQARDLISLTMVGLAIATVLQVGRLGPIGSGLLVIPTSSSGYVPGCIIAAREGGLPAVTGLLVVSSLIEIVLARFLRRLRGLLPAELSGLIVLVTGLGIAQTGMDDVVGGITAEAGIDWLPSLCVAAGTLTVMVALSIWAKGPWRTLGAIVGLACGYVASLQLGLVDPVSLDQLAMAPVLRFPALRLEVPSFGWDLVLPTIVTGLAGTLNTIGALTAAQRLNNADWRRQDMEGLSRGLLADGIGTIIGAMIGGAGVAASGSSVGLTATARATSRSIGYAAAVGFLALAFIPKFALLVLGVPRPVLGAALIYLSCSLLVSGVSIMTSRLLDNRKTFALGIAFAFAVATPALTRAGAVLPLWMSPVIASPLLASALVAIMLNPILRIGIRQQVVLDIPDGGLPHQTVATFIERAGAAWGARREVIDQAQGPIAECLDTLVDGGLATGPSRLALGFNELQLDARISWYGTKLPLSKTRPTKAELLADDDAAARMAGYLLGRLASRVTSRESGGVAELHLVFDH
nr:solute carrier family 23 protein [Acidisphaera sp. L21]